MFTLMINLTIVKTYIKRNLLGLKLEILYLFKAETIGMLLKFFGIIMSLRLKINTSLSQTDSSLQF